MADKIRFDGRVAIVTGAGAGLGRAYALELARRGAKVVVNDLGLASATADTETSTKAADAVVAEIKAAGGVAVANYDSVTTWDGGNNIVKTALDNFGKLDILINNAGFVRDRSFMKMTPEDFDAVIKVNNYGAFNVTKPAVVAMKENGYGRIVNTSSAAIFGSFGQANYDTAKAGMIGFTHNLAYELEKYGINSNAICPMGMTRMTANSLPAQFAEWMKPEAIAVTVAYLCSEECTENGVTIHATGPVLNRIALFASPAVVAGKSPLPTVEDVRDVWSKVVDLKEAEMADFREHITAGIFAKITELIGE